MDPSRINPEHASEILLESMKVDMGSLGEIFHTMNSHCFQQCNIIYTCEAKKLKLVRFLVCFNTFRF